MTIFLWSECLATLHCAMSPCLTSKQNIHQAITEERTRGSFYERKIKIVLPKNTQKISVSTQIRIHRDGQGVLPR